MKNVQSELSPVNPPPKSRREQIVRWWMDLELSGDAGGTTWEVLDPIRDRVTECLSNDNISHAESLTAKALLLVAGIKEF